MSSIHPTVLWAVGCVIGVLVVASIGVWGLRKARPGSDFSELTARVKSWWVMVSVFFVALILSRAVSLGFFCLVSFLAFKEYISLIPTRRADRRVLFWAYFAIPVQYLWIGYEWYGLFVIWIPVYMFLFLPLRMVLIGETDGFLRGVGTIHWGLMTTVFSLSHMAALLVFPAAGNERGGGPALLLFLVFLTQFNDVAQYLWGKSLGRHRAAPTVSPGKTVEGLLGALVTTVVLAWLLSRWLTPFDTREALVTGVIIGLGGFVGDIVISAVKRDIGVKDSGTLLPGHGGILDRLDSLTFTAPLFFHFVWYTHGL